MWVGLEGYEAMLHIHDEVMAESNATAVILEKLHLPLKSVGMIRLCGYQTHAALMALIELHSQFTLH